jgi:hypothetical protein
MKYHYLFNLGHWIKKINDPYLFESTVKMLKIYGCVW